MTMRDYVLIANALTDTIRDPALLGKLACRLADDFARDKHFESERWHRYILRRQLELSLDANNSVRDVARQRRARD